MGLMTLDQLFSCQLHEMLDAEKRIIEALTSLKGRVKEKALAQAIATHLEETKDQAKRLDEILRQQPGTHASEGPKQYKAIQGLIAEADEVSNKLSAPLVRECVLIGCLQNVEHYEISAYGTLVALAKLFERDKAQDLLDKSLSEEYHADKVLNKIAEGGIFTKSLNKDAVEETKSLLKQQLVNGIQKILACKHQLAEFFSAAMNTAQSPDLKKNFQHCLKEARRHIEELTSILGTLGATPSLVASPGLDGLIADARRLLTAEAQPQVRDCALIIAAQKLHQVLYACCGTTAAFAKALDLDDIASKLSRFVSEEGASDERLSKLATGGLFSTGLNQLALQGARAA